MIFFFIYFIETFTNPEDRQCYYKFEKNLTYMPYERGYRYIMNNCLLHEAIVQIVWDCKCKPSFHNSDLFPPELKYCTGKELNCLQSKLSSMAIGTKNQGLNSDNNVKSNKIGDLERLSLSPFIIFIYFFSSVVCQTQY